MVDKGYPSIHVGAVPERMNVGPENEDDSKLRVSKNLKGNVLGSFHIPISSGSAGIACAAAGDYKEAKDVTWSNTRWLCWAQGGDVWLCQSGEEIDVIHSLKWI